MSKDILELLKAEVGDKPAMILRQAIGEIAQLRQRIVSAKLYAEVRTQVLDDLRQQLAQFEARAVKAEAEAAALHGALQNRDEALAMAFKAVGEQADQRAAAEARAEAAEAALENCKGQLVAARYGADSLRLERDMAEVLMCKAMTRAEVAEAVLESKARPWAKAMEMTGGWWPSLLRIDELHALRQVAEAAQTYLVQHTTANRRALRDALAALDAARGQKGRE